MTWPIFYPEVRTTHFCRELGLRCPHSEDNPFGTSNTGTPDRTTVEEDLELRFGLRYPYSGLAPLCSRLDHGTGCPRRDLEPKYRDGIYDSRVQDQTSDPNTPYRSSDPRTTDRTETTRISDTDTSNRTQEPSVSCSGFRHRWSHKKLEPRHPWSGRDPECPYSNLGLRRLR